MDSRQPPSSVAKANVITKQQDEPSLYNGRPPTSQGFNVWLFHTAFENFARRYHGSEKPVDEREAAVHEFLVHSAGYYENKKARLTRARPLFRTLLGCELLEVENHGGSYAAGTILYSTAQAIIGIRFPHFELSNEIGTGGTDATLQAGLLNRKFWSYEEVSRASCCPAFLLVIVASWLRVLGAVFADKPIVQSLTQLVWPGHMHARKTQHDQVTRLFAAPSVGIVEPANFYGQLNFGEFSKARVFLHITSFTGAKDGRKVQFTYEGYTDPDTEDGKAVFIANTGDGQKIVVKFTEVYNDAGHSLLAADGLAPPVLSCDRSTFSDFVMAIMGYVDGKQLFHRLFHRFLHETPSGVLSKVSEALKTPHANNLEFGDLRSPNILVTGQYDIQLVDFDWCGKVGEGKYPADINLVDIQWPEGVAPD